MEHDNVIILGAGASAEAGAPVMSEFFDCVEELRQAEPDPPNRVLDPVLTGIRLLERGVGKSRIDTNNLEAVFVAFEMVRLLDHLPGWDREERIEQLVDLMAQTIAWVYARSARLRFGADPQTGDRVIVADEAHECLAKALYAPARAQVPAIISFNYDCLVDYALATNDMRPLYHLDGSLPDVAPDGRMDVDLLKLHGSTGWGMYEKSCRECGTEIHRYEFQGQPLAGDQAYWPDKNTAPPDQPTLDVRDLLNNSAKPNSVKCLIVPPTWDKTQHYHQIESVWRRAGERLSQAENVFIFGYSLPETDMFFRYLWAVGSLGTSRIRRFWVFDKSPSAALDERYRTMIGPLVAPKYVLIKAEFGDVMKRLAAHEMRDEPELDFASRMKRLCDEGSKFMRARDRVFSRGG